MSLSPGASGRIALVVSDVDGTLVTTDKRLTPAARTAVRRLGEAGIAFTLASARPPIGLRGLVAELGLTRPLAAYNGGTVVGPDLKAISESLIPPEAARETVRRLLRAGVDVWVFAGGQWCLRDPQAPYTDLERRTLEVEPRVVADLDPLLDKAAKIVGVSGDAGLLAGLEQALGTELEGRAGARRSQSYYLDITPPGVSKGAFVRGLARSLGVARERVATLGDGGNDVAMFRESGLSIAMGNADAGVRAAADRVAPGNDEDGFARAIETWVLPAGRG